MILPETFINHICYWIRLDSKTYSISSFHSDSIRQLDYNLLSVGSTLINKLHLYTHVKYIFPDKLFYQRIY